MRTIARIAAPVLIAGAMIGFVGNGFSAAAAPSVTAAPVKAAASASLTQGFYVTNHSQFPTTLTGIQDPGKGDGTPAIGTVLLPGQSLRYEKVFWFGNSTGTKLDFTSAMPSGQWMVYQVELHIDPFLNIPQVRLPDLSGSPLSLNEDRQPTSTSVILEDSTASTVIVPKEKAQQQTDLLNELCKTSAACVFSRDARTVAPSRTIEYDKGVNNTASVRTFTTSSSTVAGASTTLELTAQAKTSVLSAVELTVTGKLGQTFTKTETQTESRTYSISPYSIGQMTAKVPMVRDTGTFTVKLGKTTWILQNVSFDSRDMSKAISYDTTERAMTAAEKEYYKKTL
jgi:hypothetical protein